MLKSFITAKFKKTAGLFVLAFSAHLYLSRVFKMVKKRDNFRVERVRTTAEIVQDVYREFDVSIFTNDQVLKNCKFSKFLLSLNTDLVQIIWTCMKLIAS